MIKFLFWDGGYDDIFLWDGGYDFLFIYINGEVQLSKCYIFQVIVVLFVLLVPPPPPPPFPQHLYISSSNNNIKFALRKNTLCSLSHIIISLTS